MPRLTEEILRRRAEHNEGMLSNLEEVALHQFEIEKIENLDKLCRHIRILLLQNNIIEKIENVSKLKELHYLNLALNNITMIENLEGCESLHKLDLTANFIDLENYMKSMENLSKVSSIRELYMTGNPITDWKNYREFTIAMVPQILMLDGKEVSKSERITAIQKIEELNIDLLTQIELKLMKQINKENEENEQKEMEINEQNKDGNKTEEYTKESRKKMYLDMAREKEEDDRRKNPHKYEQKQESQMFKPDGEIRQCNEGKFEYVLREWDEPDFSSFELKVPKHLDTSLIDVNLNPKWISVRVKGKLTQMKLMEEIIVEKSKIQRSQITGFLLITMPKLMPNYMIKKIKNQDKSKKTNDGFENKENLLKNVDQENHKFKKEKIITKTHDETTFDDIPDLE